jgi:hypothetical protein
MDPNPYEPPKELGSLPPDDASKSAYRSTDNAQLLLGCATLMAGYGTYMSTNVPFNQVVIELPAVPIRVLAAILFIVGVLLIWGPVSRHEGPP